MVGNDEHNVGVADAPPPIGALREGWETYDAGNGMQVSFPSDSEPHINWKHVDGPMLSCRDGAIHWLSWWERFCLWAGIYDINHLDKKHGYYTKQRRLA